jgi:DNA-binding transcriptional regulator YiaG
MASEKRPRRVPAVIADTRRNPGFALGAFGLSAWAYIGMSHTIAAYEGPELGYALGVAYEALVIGLAWEGRRRADRALETGRQPTGHGRWLGGAIVVGVLSGALAAWHGWLLGEGIFAASRAVAPVLAAVAVHLFFQSASSARELDRQAKIHTDRETAVLDMLDAVRLAQIAPEGQRQARIADVNAAVTRVHRHVPAAVTAEVTRPHLESERTIRDVVQAAATLAGEWMPEENAPDPAKLNALLPGIVLPGAGLPGVDLPGAARPDSERTDAASAVDEPDNHLPEAAPAGVSQADNDMVELIHTGSVERVHLEDKYAPVKPAADLNPPASATVTDWGTHSESVPTPVVADPARPLTTQQISEIRVLRWEQNLSVEEVAARLGVSVSSVSRYAPSSDVPTTATGSMAVVPAGLS